MNKYHAVRDYRALAVCAVCQLSLTCIFARFIIVFILLAAADWARGAAANLPSYIAISAIIAPRKL